MNHFFSHNGEMKVRNRIKVKVEGKRVRTGKIMRDWRRNSESIKTKENKLGTFEFSITNISYINPGSEEIFSFTIYWKLSHDF